MKATTATVYLIGAGPGDPDLISVKGKEILVRCDVVIYDALVNEMLVASLPDTVRRIYVGKRGGMDSTPQAEINRILLREAARARIIARLKGGDPLLLGRGGEEMEFLRAHKIAYEIVPGVSSALAAPAFSGIPVTHRSLARSVAIVTGHLKDSEPIESLTIPAADTVVLLMAMKHLGALVEKLLATGAFSRRTPAAIIRNATFPDQQSVQGTLGTIERLKDRRGLTAPAVVVVGETAAFAKTLCWFKRPPLAGTRVVILRTPEQSGELMHALHEKGATVIPWPVIRIRPRIGALNRIDASFLLPFTMVVFTSPNGVRIFMEALFKKGIDARIFSGKKLFSIGEKTGETLSAYGIIPDGIPEQYRAEGVLDILPGMLHGEKVLIPRASKAREVLSASLKQRGAAVTVLPLYDTVKTAMRHCPVRNGDYVLFTSSSTADFFFSHPLCKATEIRPCCIGAVTAATVRGYYKGETAVAKNATVPALIDALVRAVRSRSLRKRSSHD